MSDPQPITPLAYAEPPVPPIPVRPVWLIVQNVAAAVSCFLPVYEDRSVAGWLAEAARQLVAGSRDFDSFLEVLFFSVTLLCIVGLAVWNLRLVIWPAIPWIENLSAHCVSYAWTGILGLIAVYMCLAHTDAFTPGVFLGIVVGLGGVMVLFLPPLIRRTFATPLLLLTACAAASNTLIVLLAVMYSTAWTAIGFITACVVGCQILGGGVMVRIWRGGSNRRQNL